MVSPDESNFYLLYQDYQLQKYAINETFAFGSGIELRTRFFRKYYFLIDEETEMKENWKEDVIPHIYSTQYHCGSILGMDMCTKRGIVATCGKDKTVHFWNVVDRSWEFMKSFLEEPLGYGCN